MARWRPLVRARAIDDPKKEAAVLADAMRVAKAAGVPWDEARIRQVLEEEKNLPIWRNLDYQVAVRRTEVDNRRDGRPVHLVHLSIRRVDRKTIRDWRDLQRIKNQILGEDCEAVELFPAESRLVDNANQYHLWGFDDPDFRFPFGFEERVVSDSPSPESGVVQRRLD